MIPGPLRSSDQIFAQLKFMNIQDIYKYHVSKFVFKCFNHTAHEQLHEWFKFNYERHGHRTTTQLLNSFMNGLNLIMRDMVTEQPHSS